MDTSILKDLQLSSSSDHKAYGKVVRYYCFSERKYVTEKHKEDYLAFMVRCDSDVLRTLLIEIYPDLKKLAEGNKLKSINVNDALDVVRNTIIALGFTGHNGQQYNGLVPYSTELLQTVTKYLQLVLPELNTVTAVHNNINTDKIYTKLLHVVTELANRYCTPVSIIP